MDLKQDRHEDQDNINGSQAGENAYDHAWDDNSAEDDKQKDDQDDQEDHTSEGHEGNIPAELADQEQQANSWKSELDRHKAENEALRKQLDQALALQKSHPLSVSAEAPTPAQVSSVPDDIYQDVASRNPDLALLAKENSVLGEGIRRRLDSYGIEEATDYAAPALEALRTRRELDRQRADAERIQHEHQAQDWKHKVFSAAPDFKAAMDAGQGAHYFGEVEAWARAKSYDEAQNLLGIMNQGSADDTILLLERFRNERQVAQKSQIKSAAAAMSAVPGHQQGMGIKQGAKKNDYDAAWDEN